MTNELNNLPKDLKQTYLTYITKKEQDQTPDNTLRKARQIILLFLTYLSDLGLNGISELNRNHIKDFTAYLSTSENEESGKQYKVSTVNRYLTEVQSFLGYLYKDKLIAGHFEVTKVRGVDSINRNILTRKEIAALFKLEPVNLYQAMYKVIVVLLYATGLRINEVLSLKLKDIDFTAGNLIVFEVKTNKERFVEIGEVGIDYLKLYLEHIRSKVCYDYKTSDYVFTSHYQGKKLYPQTVNHYIRRFCKKVKIDKNISCHSFRHSYGTHLLEGGLGIKEVSALLGHRDLVSTERYTRLSPEHLRKTLQNFHPLESL
jgi:site-specific recombinase XerD